MSSTNSKNVRTFAVLLTLCALMICISLALTLAVAANGESGQAAAKMTASLVDPAISAKDKSATVTVEVTGVQLIDPAMTDKKPTKGQGHLHYRVDDGPVIATTATKLSFHGLTPGKHKIVVVVANNDHSTSGLEQTLEITVP